MCEKAKVPGITYDGGYADYTVVPAEAIAAVPDTLSSVEAAPLVCAGITTYNALRHSGAKAGYLVAVLGMGGLGHLGVQFASKMGFRTVAIARGADKAKFAAQLGAHHYIDSQAEDVAKSLTALGGAQVVLATVVNADAMAATIDGLAVDGVLLVVGAPAEPLRISALPIISRRRSIKGWASGIATDSEDTLKFAIHTGVRPIIERYPLERASEAYERMISGKARFRAVLETGA
jgi:D-arabinose 1-dehydrogenase-like Zn-dependent alcohol dehydrogenase